MELAVRVKASDNAALIWKRKYQKMKASGKGWVGAWGEPLSKLMVENRECVLLNDGSDALLSEELFSLCQQEVEAAPVSCQLVVVDEGVMLPGTGLARPMTSGWDEILRPLRFKRDRQKLEDIAKPLVEKAKASKAKASAKAKPEKPSKPSKPSKPEKPSKPSAPEKPEKPKTPAKPSKPEKPAKPARPAKPSAPEKPKKPTA